jgi:hypothetical protein
MKTRKGMIGHPAINWAAKNLSEANRATRRLSFVSPSLPLKAWTKDSRWVQLLQPEACLHSWRRIPENGDWLSL